MTAEGLEIDRMTLAIMNKDLLKIYCNDPESGKREMEMGEFISAWRGSDNVLIKVKIGGKLQRIMPEYADETQREPQWVL